eukprot:1792144-Lingulodinium_polyedra.AAC.1
MSPLGRAPVESPRGDIAHGTRRFLGDAEVRKLAAATQAQRVCSGAGRRAMHYALQEAYGVLPKDE